MIAEIQIRRRYEFLLPFSDLIVLMKYFSLVFLGVLGAPVKRVLERSLGG
jgi:hypothetical protein